MMLLTRTLRSVNYKHTLFFVYYGTQTSLGLRLNNNTLGEHGLASYITKSLGLPTVSY